MAIEINAGAVGGRFRMTAIRPDGTERVLADWFENLITDDGMDFIAQRRDSTTIAHVGSGSAPPTFGDVKLQNHVASASYTQGGELYGSTSVPPYYGWWRRNYRFAVGVATGNLTEVGVGWAWLNQGNNAYLFSRALIKNTVGEPVTITVLADEILEVTYELRLYAPLADKPFQLDISGTVHSCVRRAAVVSSSSGWVPARLFGGNWGEGMHAYSGNLGAITESPSGIYEGFPFTYGTYEKGSFALDLRATLPLTYANFPGGVKSIYYFTNFVGAYQCSFTPPIMKDPAKVLILDMRLVWSRYVA